MGEKKRGRYFGDEFKRDAVQLIIEKEVPLRKVARDLDIIRTCCISGEGSSWQKATMPQ